MSEYGKIADFRGNDLKAGLFTAKVTDLLTITSCIATDSGNGELIFPVYNVGSSQTR